MKIKFLLSLILYSIIIACSSGAVTVVKSASHLNPKLYFQGISGDTQASSYMNSNLKNCGWFDITNSQQDAKYSVSGNVSGGNAVLNVVDRDTGSSFKITMNISGDKQAALYKVTDSILKKIFNVPGICNSKIAFVAQVGNGKEIYTCNFDGTDTKGFTNSKTLSIDPSWALNNSLIVYTKYRNTFTDIVGKSVSNGKTYRLAVFPGLNNSASVSPNGKYLSLILSRDRQVELYIKELKGKGIKRLTNDRAVEGSPCWSPEGRYICYVSDRTGRASLYTVDLKTDNTKRLRTVGSEAVTPDWSPVSNQIVYSARFGRSYTLALYDVSKGTSTVVDINSAGDWMSPSWAPDGRHVICSRKLNYRSQLYMVDTWTGRSVKFTNFKYNLTSPSWSGLL